MHWTLTTREQLVNLWDLCRVWDSLSVHGAFHSASVAPVAPARHRSARLPGPSLVPVGPTQRLGPWRANSAWRNMQRAQNEIWGNQRFPWRLGKIRSISELRLEQRWTELNRDHKMIRMIRLYTICIQKVYTPFLWTILWTCQVPQNSPKLRRTQPYQAIPRGLKAIRTTSLSLQRSGCANDRHRQLERMASPMLWTYCEHTVGKVGSAMFCQNVQRYVRWMEKGTHFLV